MSDLNEWRLAYSDTVLDFGLLSTEFPFVTQVAISDTDSRTQDADHPTADGGVMGRDSIGGFTLTFDVTTVPEFPPLDKPWMNALDLFSQFRGKWRADYVRREPGRYATLSNLERQRMVYGRPRKIAPKFDRLRKGQIGFVCTFDSIDPNFYSTTEKSHLYASGGLHAIANEGDVAAWPVVEFTGTDAGAKVEFLTAGGAVDWTLLIPAAVPGGQTLRVDTRPWTRSATLNGGPAGGRVRGTQMELCTVPPGVRNARAVGLGAAGSVNFRWRDAYAGF